MKILLAAADERAARLEAGLVAAQVVRLRAGESLREAAIAHSPDVVILDMAQPGGDGLEGVRQVMAAAPLPIVLFVDGDDAAVMEEAIAAGVSSYNVLGPATPDIEPIIRSAIAMFRRTRRIEAELEERRAVNRAKALLMRRRGCSEPQAYAALRQQAMDSGRRIAEVAAELVAKTDGA